MLRVPALILLGLALVASPLVADGEAPDPREVIKAMKDRDPAVRLMAVAEAELLPDSSVTSQLLKLLKDDDFRVRMATAITLSVRPEKACRRKAAAALATRLGPLSSKALDEEEYLVVIAALHDLAEPATIKALMDLEVTEDRDTAKERLMAVGNIPHKDAIEALIAFMSSGRRRSRGNLRGFAVQALTYATGAKLGQNPDTWRAWWKDHKATFDFEAAATAREEERQAVIDKEEAREEKRRAAEEKRAEREKRLREREEKRGEREREKEDQGEDEED